MAAEQDVIKEFLVSLGFKIDEAGLRKFTGALGLGSGVAGTALTASKAVLGVAASAEAMVTVFASSMEKLYYASRRTGASVENIQALEYGSRRIGLAAGVAREALEAMSSAVRMNPGLRSVMDGLVGHKTEGMDQAKAMIELIQRLSGMQHFVGARFAGMFGIDEQTFLMVKQGMPELLKAEQDRVNLNKTLGVDAQAAAAASKEYMNSLREITEKISAIGSKWSVEVMPYFREFNRLVNDALDRLAQFKLNEGIETIIDATKPVRNAAAGFQDIKNGNVWEGVKTVVKNSPGSLLLRKGFDKVNEWRDSYRPGGSRSDSPMPPVAAAPEVAMPTRAPLGIRQNNPGNLRSWGGAAVRNGFAQFGTSQEGLSAMAGNLVKYTALGLTSVRDIIARWAPANENNTAAYIDAVTKRLGVGAGESLNMKNPATMSRVMDAIIRQENGYNPYGTSDLMAAASGRLGSGNDKQVTINQKTDIHVAGTADPMATGAAVGREQSRVNGDIVRNMAGAVQ